MRKNGGIVILFRVFLIEDRAKIGKKWAALTLKHHSFRVLIMTDYKDTLNLPQTDFPMKADLAKREPLMLQFWEEKQIYQKLRQVSQNRKKYILHDGPPYANGHIHIGHALNKTLKDIVLKSKSLSGFDTPFIPGWDCHGLPIELNVERAFEKEKKKVSQTEFREACRNYALSQMQIQRDEFKRLGVFGDWENPYMTMDFSYEADIVRALSKIIANGHLLRGSKPVHWCVECGSALAEAEVEYQDKTSFSIDVAFRVVDVRNFLQRFAKKIDERSVIIPIWTTTPWTLPANQAVALNPNINYALVSHADFYLLIAESLVPAVMTRYNFLDYTIVDHCIGEALEGFKLQHPFLSRQVPLVLSDHVTVETGTGAVHIAPAHGQEDYTVGSRYNLAIENPVDDRGRFISTTEFFAGEHVYKVNEHVLEVLQEKHALLYQTKIQHSYPHCWRHKVPLIFRATPQWFISMEQQGLRTQTLEAINHTQWSPEWAQARIADMILQRPDWCISRQRSWGTPITLFVHRETEELHPNTTELMEQVADLIEKKGIDAWADLDPKTLLGADAEHYRKVTDTLDVWFDSGVSHACVLARRPELQWPADLYLEGSDQFRGWFHSSLLTGTAMRGEAPYKMVLSHGFTVDAHGRKMSKSIGNVIAPEQVWNKLGADILRLWVASTDFRNEQSISDEILQRSAETYRRIRNTCRFLLSNLFDFNPDKNLLPFEKLIALDQWAIDRVRRLQIEIQAAYDKQQFHQVSQKIQNFCTVDMGSFYLDIIKDRVYTTAENSIARRSAQTAMYYIIEALVRWMAPILSFTAEEIWQHMPWKNNESVFLNTWLENIPELREDNPLNADFWSQIMSIRNVVNGMLEQRRKDGMGSSLEAILTLTCHTEHSYEMLKNLGDELRFVFITSYAKVELVKNKELLRDDAKDFKVSDIVVGVEKSSYQKCERCWHRREEVGTDAAHPGLCARCITNIEQSGEIRHYA